MSTPKHRMDLFKAVPVITDQALKEDKDIEAGYYFHSKKLGEGNYEYLICSNLSIIIWCNLVSG